MQIKLDFNEGIIMQIKLDFNEGNTPAVYQLDPEKMNLIYVPVHRILPQNKKKEYLKSISEG